MNVVPKKHSLSDPSQQVACRAEGVDSSPTAPLVFKKNTLHHKPFDEEKEREPLMKYVNLGKPGSYEREY